MQQGDVISNTPSNAGRRSFLSRLAAGLVAGVLVVFPFAAGWGVLLHPLRRRTPAEKDEPLDMAGFVRICPLESLPADGVPHEFVVTADVADAWTRSPGQRIGSLFLTRATADGEPRVIAFTATCPHLGCAVEFDAADGRFECPCHESAFAKNGEKLFGPSLRGLDPLEVKLVGDAGAMEVWVEFQQFRAGIEERTPIG
jgi:menaquinol-cytochrome c reductase iron-sulfur subunit